MQTMRIFALIVALFFALPSFASAEQQLAVSCENISVLRIEKSKDYWNVNLELSQEGTRQLYELTSQNPGEYLSICFKGDTLLRTRMYEPISSGYVSLRKATQKEAYRLARRICSKKLKMEPVRPLNFHPPFPKTAQLPEGVNIPSFKVSCDNVVEIRFYAIKDFIWLDTSGDGQLYVLHVALSPKANEELLRTLESSPPVLFHMEDQTMKKKYVQLLAGGHKIQSDAPTCDAFSEQGVLITKRKRQEAMQNARQICPAKITLLPE